MAPAGAGTPVKKLPAQGGAVRVLDLHVEARKPQRRADREHHRGDPADIAELLQAPEIQDEARGDAEIEEVREAVELRAEARGALDHARDPPVDGIEHRGEHDRAERELEAAFEREPDGGQPGAQREQRDDVGQERAQRDLAQSPEPAFPPFRIEPCVRHGPQYIDPRAAPPLPQ